MNSRRRGVPSSDPYRIVRREFINEMQDLAKAGGTLGPPPVISADEILEAAKKEEAEAGFMAALSIADDLAAVSKEAEAKLNDAKETGGDLEIEVEEDKVDLSTFDPLRWIMNINSVKRPSARLLIFHGIGQSHMYYRKWAGIFSLSNIALHCICLPGRAHRVYEGNTSINESARCILICIESFHADETWDKVPLYFFGHCSGAIIAFEVVKMFTQQVEDEEVDEETATNIEHLIVTSCKPPHLITNENKDRYGKKWFVQSDSDLMDRAANLGGVPTILRDKYRRDLLRTFIPNIRQDYMAMEKYIYEPMKRVDPNMQGSINIPVTSIGTEDDKSVRKDELIAWKEATDYGTNPGDRCKKYLFLTGGHSWMEIPKKEEVFQEFLVKICSGVNHLLEELEIPEEDDSENEREVETYYG